MMNGSMINRRRGAELPPGDTRLIDLTVDELNNIVRYATRIAIGAELPEAMAEAERQLEADGGGLRVGRKRYVFGIDGIARTFGVSRSTARRIKRSGMIDEAISQCGRSITLDQDRALELTRGTRWGERAPEMENEK